MTDLPSLQSEAVRLLALYQGTRAEERTPVIRSLAKVIVSARSGFLTEAGDPDYRGLTYAYRHWVHDLYNLAHIDRDTRQTVQAAVRYHAGAVIRESLDDETLRDLGLLKETPKERSAARNSIRSVLLNALNHGDFSHGDLLALTATHSLMAKIAGNDFADLTEDQRRIVDSSLVEIQRRAEALLARLRNEEDSVPCQESL